MEKVLPKVKLIATSLEFGDSNSVSASGAIDLDIEERLVKLKSSRPGDASDAKLTTIDVEKMKDTDGGRASTNGIRDSEANESPTPEGESNHWMHSSSDKNKPSQESSVPAGEERKKSLPSVSKQCVINVADAINVLSGDVEEGIKEKTTLLTKTENYLGVESAQKIAS